MSSLACCRRRDVTLKFLHISIYLSITNFVRHSFKEVLKANITVPLNHIKVPIAHMKELLSKKKWHTPPVDSGCRHGKTSMNLGSATRVTLSLLIHEENHVDLKVRVEVEV